MTAQKDFVERRNKALNADFTAFKEWIIKEKILYSDNPSDEVLIIAMHKMRCNSKGIYPKKKAESKKWLKEHGYSEIIQ